MSLKIHSPYLFGAYLFAGAVAGIVVIHPLVLAIMWLEFASVRVDATPFLEFMQSRLWLAFVPKHFDMAVAFIALGGCLGFGFWLFTRVQVQRIRALRFLEEEIGRTIPEIIKAGESGRVEFKSSIRWDLQKKSINRGLETVIAKTIAGFCNTRGGSLVIGVADDGNIVGLEHDYGTLKNQNRDGLERAVADIVKKKLGGDIIPMVHFSFLEIDGRDVCMLSIEPTSRAVYLDEGNASTFYIRSGNSTRHLDVREALEFAKSRWQTHS
ncbi:MAG: ATP-binding protein [Alphaproteobacteria bacterium]|nr:ATP-binding protein [Alphaproteobacteria bacterium]